jgi:acetyltransferase-like isoleucine patch superfamily enzyme
VTEIPQWHQLPVNSFNPHAWIVGEPQIGEGCWIGAFTVIDGSGGLVIGRGCEISSGAQIYTHSTVERVISERAASVTRAPVRIGEFVHVGAAAVILMGTEIGDHAVIGAGSIVLEGSVIPAWSLVVGNPGRIIPDGARKWKGS